MLLKNEFIRLSAKSRILSWRSHLVNIKPYRQSKYNVILRCVRATIVRRITSDE